MDVKQATLTELRSQLEAMNKDLERREAECREVRHKRNAIASVIELLTINKTEAR